MQTCTIPKKASKLEFTFLSHGVHTPCHSEPALAGVGISWYNFTCLGRLVIEVTAYYEIATGATHPRNDTRFDSFISTINNHLYVFAVDYVVAGVFESLGKKSGTGD